VNEICVNFTAEIECSAIDGSAELNLMEIFLAECSRLRRIIAGMGLNAADGEDVLQDISVKAMRQSAKLHTSQDCIRWLIKATVNQCLVEHRRKRSFQKQANEILQRKSEIQTNSAEKNVIAAEELEIIRQSLKKLDDNLLVPVVLRYFCDLDSKEIGEILQQNPSTIRTRLSDARMILAKSLLERGVGP
jgi:RNA polymerase sigma factor (sigma-70 family)